MKEVKNFIIYCMQHNGRGLALCAGQITAANPWLAAGFIFNFYFGIVRNKFAIAIKKKITPKANEISHVISEILDSFNNL